MSSIISCSFFVFVRLETGMDCRGSFYTLNYYSYRPLVLVTSDAYIYRCGEYAQRYVQFTYVFCNCFVHSHLTFCYTLTHWDVMHSYHSMETCPMHVFCYYWVHSHLLLITLCPIEILSSSPQYFLQLWLIIIKVILMIDSSKSNITPITNTIFFISMIGIK